SRPARRPSRRTRSGARCSARLRDRSPGRRRVRRGLRRRASGGRAGKASAWAALAGSLLADLEAREGFDPRALSELLLDDRLHRLRVVLHPLLLGEDLVGVELLELAGDDLLLHVRGLRLDLLDVDRALALDGRRGDLVAA